MYACVYVKTTGARRGKSEREKLESPVTHTDGSDARYKRCRAEVSRGMHRGRRVAPPRVQRRRGERARARPRRRGDTIGKRRRERQTGPASRSAGRPARWPDRSAGRNARCVFTCICARAIIRVYHATTRGIAGRCNDEPIERERQRGREKMRAREEKPQSGKGTAGAAGE